MITIPLPPSQNHAYITTRKGQRIMTEHHRQFKQGVRLSVIVQIRGKVLKPYISLSLLQMAFFWPDKRARDYDNYAKISLDCIKGLLVEDDCCWNIKELALITRGIDKKNPRVEIEWII